ncbi:HAD family hydrolase [Candidatus Nomurabacteria bacterium]|nr:HAD family hydrolase [Candidatus Nomurabacteria bacterium]
MKNIIFDWSGVVKDAVTSQLWIVNRIFGKYGVEAISLEEFQENWEQPYTLFYKKYLPLDFDEEGQEKDYKEAIFHPDCPKALAYPGMVDLIKELKSSGFFLAVVSSDLKETLYSEMKEYGLENIFDHISVEVHDKLETVQQIIEKNNLDTEQTLFVGDSTHEIEVAHEVGIKSVAVTWGFVSRERLEAKKPEYLVGSVDDLEKII